MASSSQPDEEQIRLPIADILFRVDLFPYRKVPERFRKGNEEFYRPRVVSIGPCHDNETNLRCESIKSHYRYAFTRRYSVNNIDDVASSLGKPAMRYYGLVVAEQSPKDFGNKMMEDGIFLLELMLRSRFPEYREGWYLDPIFNSPGIIVDVCRDILLIANQLPLIVLEELYKQFVIPHPRPDEKDVSLAQLACDFFNAHLFGKDLPPTPTDNELHDAFLNGHLVDFVRCCYRPRRKSTPSSSSSSSDGDDYNITVELIPPTVTTLYEAGVRFEKLISTGSGLNIEFDNGSLKIPYLDYRTGTFFLNVMVVEEYKHIFCLTDGNYVSQFMFFMGWMIRTSKDVDILIESGIISRMLGSNRDLVALFDRISKMGWPRDYFDRCQEMNDYCASSPWHKWKATLKRDYFDTPWKIASTMAAVILLALTLMQTVCSFLSL